MHQEAIALREVNDISFMSPEAWEAINISIELLEEFVLFSTLLVNREASCEEAENYFGEIIVLIRFLYALNKFDD